MSKVNILDEVKATLEIEDLKMPDETEKVLTEYVAGRKSQDDLEREIMDQVKKIIEG